MKGKHLEKWGEKEIASKDLCVRSSKGAQQALGKSIDRGPATDATLAQCLLSSRYESLLSA